MRADAATTRYRKNPGTGPNCRNPPEYGKRRLRKPPLKALLVFCASGSYRFHRGDDGGTPAYSDARKQFASEAGRVLAITLRRPNRQCGNVAF